MNRQSIDLNKLIPLLLGLLFFCSSAAFAQDAQSASVNSSSEGRSASVAPINVADQQDTTASTDVAPAEKSPVADSRIDSVQADAPQEQLTPAPVEPIDANALAEVVEQTEAVDLSEKSALSATAEPAPAPRAESIDLKEVIPELSAPPATEAQSSVASSDFAASSISAGAEQVPTNDIASTSTASSTSAEPAAARESQPHSDTDIPAQSSADNVSASVKENGAENPVESAAVSEPVAEPQTLASKFILGMQVPPNTSARLIWMPEGVASGLAEQTPVLVVNGKNPGKTLCLTAAVHGDELNGIEMIRRVMYRLDPDKLTGTVIGVPVVNLMGFRRNSRYLPDRRDLNRYFPGNTHGSSAARIAHSFFINIVRHCDALVDIHTGSFHRTNLTQLRADLANEQVAALAQSFGNISVLNSRGNTGSLRAAAVRAGIPSVTVEAGEPLRLQNDVVAEGTRAIETLMAKMEMYGRQSKWNRHAPVYYKSVWVRANQSGILLSRVPLGKRVTKGEVLGTVTDPITNASSDIVSPYQGRILGMALDQVVLPGFAAYHIGIQTPEALLIEESQLDDEDGDDGFNRGINPTGENAEIFNKPVEVMDDEEE